MSTRKVFERFLLTASVAFIVNILIYYLVGHDKAVEFLGGYIIELSLSIDNLFLFLLIFSSFGIAPSYQRRILSYGIIGAIFLRLIFVAIGVTIVGKFKWVLYIFGILLVISGIKMITTSDDVKSFNGTRSIKLLHKFIPVTNSLYGEKFFVRINKVLYATPLFAILFLIEGSDIVFAIDSIPAIFSITTDPFIVYTSNILALLGLRNLYFLLLKLHTAFEYVKYGVGVILVFTGVKMALSFRYHIPVDTSIIIIISILMVSIVSSVIINKFKLVRN